MLNCIRFVILYDFYYTSECTFAELGLGYDGLGLENLCGFTIHCNTMYLCIWDYRNIVY
jgi:hypothetical protein